MAMATSSETTAPYRMTVEQYEVLVEVAHLDRVELVDGVMYGMSPEGPVHADIGIALLDLLRERYPDRKVKILGSVRLDSGSLWEPDAYVLDEPREAPMADEDHDYPDASSLLLAAEVSVTTLRHDRLVKLPVYARNGIPECWIVRPGGDATRYTEPGEGGYRRSEKFHLDLG